MIIAYQSSELFSSICMVSLCSLLENNKNEEEMYIYILSKDFSDKSLQLVKDMLESAGYDRDNALRIDISDLDKRFDICFDDYDGKWGIDSFCKVLLGKLLPKSVHRVLYLDSDTIVCRDIHDFYHIDMGDCAVAAVKDFISKEYFDYLGLSDTDVYCNSGVILYDLDKWRDLKIENEISILLKEKNGCVFFSEQSVLNIVASKRIKVVGLEYNLTSIPVCLTWKQVQLFRHPYNSYDKQDICASVKRPAIIHFTSLFVINGRVWNSDNNHPLKKYFDKYAKQVSSFKYSKVSKDKRSIFCICKFIPSPLLFLVIGNYYRNGRIKKYKKYIRLVSQNKEK